MFESTHTNWTVCIAPNNQNDNNKTDSEINNRIQTHIYVNHYFSFTHSHSFSMCSSLPLSHIHPHSVSLNLTGHYIHSTISKHDDHHHDHHCHRSYLRFVFSVPILNCSRLNHSIILNQYVVVVFHSESICLLSSVGVREHQSVAVCRLTRKANNKNNIKN